MIEPGITLWKNPESRLQGREKMFRFRLPLVVAVWLESARHVQGVASAA